MKRRNADCGKLRRPIKRNKITEGMYGSTTVLYMKFLVLWAIVITADFMFMFRFEFLWPFWLLLRSVHDSFKYKGLAFSVLFVCIAITSDLVCLFFIPVHWLLFAASTYVWVQYVWHTDKGICLPTIILWMLFVYLEAGIRWKDTRHMPHLDLCRPFAAHCIGYPVVTLGFGFKSYVGYRMRQRKQREVAKENEFYMQLLQQALPPEETPEDAQTSVTGAGATAIAVAAVGSAATQNAQNSSHAVTTLNNVSTTASNPNAMATLNGVLATSTQAQNNHHNQHHHNNNQMTLDAHQTNHHHNSNHNSNGGGSNSASGNGSHNSNSISSMSAATAAASAGVTGGVVPAMADDKTYVQINCVGGGGANSGANNNTSGTGYGGGSSGATSNGHIGGNSKSHRRSMDKESRHKGSSGGGGGVDTDSKHNKTNSYHAIDNSNSNHSNAGKDKNDADSGNNFQVHHHTHQHNLKEKSEDHRMNSSKKSNVHCAVGGTTSPANGNVLQYDIDDVVAVEPVERTKGRRNRAKKDKDNASKDNHQPHHNNNNHNNNSNSNSNINNSAASNLNANSSHAHNNHQQSKDSSQNHNSNNNNNSDASSVSSSTSSASSTSSSSSVSASTTSTISNLASKVVTKICESCLKLEADVRKYRSELSHMKQIENELRQKLESNLTTKSCLQAKQRECDELEKRIQELTNGRHADMLQLQTAERRLGEERRQKQSLDAQLNNEKKARKIAEEKAARPECSAQCKQRKQQMDEEIKQLRRDLKMADDAKQQAEHYRQKCEQELRTLEAEIRNRDSNKILMNAILQDKISSLEKNLSAETRVKLDLFSALGDAKRQLEIAESRRRSKEDEVLDLKAKIAQLLAVMPTDSLLPACGSASASSMLRMNDTPPLQSGPGPASPMLSSLSAAAAQQAAGPGGHQLGGRVAPNSAGDYVQQERSDYVTAQQQQQQQQCGGVVPVSVATAVLAAANSAGGAGTGGSNLDPNATVYTPKGGPGGQGGGVGVVVGGAGDA